MEHQKILNLFGNTSNHLSKLWTKNWVEIRNGTDKMCNINSQITF